MLNRGDKVWFYYIDQNGKVQFHQGTIEIVDEDGTWENPGIPSYDIYAVTDKYPDGCLFKHNSEDGVATSLEDLINIFREKRNEVYNKSQAYQAAIDHAVMTSHEVHIKPGDYIYIKSDNTYIKVDSVIRLFRGIRIVGKGVITSDHLYYYRNDMMTDVDWNYVKDIKIITKKEFLNECKKGYEDFINSLESGINKTISVPSC